MRLNLRKWFIALCTIVSCVFVSSCGKKFVDYAHDGSCIINLDYEGRTFWQDGIEKVTLKSCIDGDTVHFTTSTQDPENHTTTLKARFYGIDTPESTGKVQPYGKQASNFTKEKITNASEHGTIVVSSPQDYYGAPSADSTGQRYVSLVWINETKKNAPATELSLLNLYIVQEGFSWVKNTADLPEYESVFASAEQQAKDFKLGLFSGKDDPLFNYGSYVETTLLDIKKEVVKAYEDSDYENAYNNVKVRVQGTVIGCVNHILYLQNHYTQEDDPDLPVGGDYAGLNIFMGMGSYPTRFTTPGNYIQVCGLCSTSENFGFQMHDANFPMVTYSENDAKVIMYADEVEEDADRKLVEFSYTKAQFNTMISEKDFDRINCACACSDVLECSSAYITDSGTTLKFKDTPLQCYLTFNYIPDPEKPNEFFTQESDFKGKKFRISGVYCPHITTSGKMTFQINPINSSYVVCVNE